MQPDSPARGIVEIGQLLVAIGDMDCSKMTFLQVMQSLQSKAHENVTIKFKKLSHDELYGIKRAQEAAKADIAMQFQAQASGGRANYDPVRNSTIVKAQQHDKLTQLIQKADTPQPAPVSSGVAPPPAAPAPAAGGQPQGQQQGDADKETYWW